MEDIRIKTDLNLDDGHSSSLLSSSSSLSSVCAEQDVLVVRMCALQLYSLSGVCVFRALRVCVLCDNSITDIQPLQQCVNLLKLDLKGNQISQLPEAAFWKNLKNLQLLFLHDNNISVMNHVSGLSVSPSLSALTLYETPLSRTRNYRHCVINSIISLKALDHHVISDEEIIENWKLPLRYQAMAPNLSLILYSSATTQSDEIKALHRIISEINRVQASFSPTLIIQKWIRGHLTRKHLGLCGAPVPLKTLVRNVTSVSSVWDISRRSWIRSDPHILELQKDMLSIRSFHSKNLTDIKPPCNTPQPHNHGNNLNRAYKEREKEESLRERAQRVMKVQDQRDEARGRREGFMAAQRREALQRQKWEQDKLETTLKLQTAKQEQEVQLVHQKYRRFLVEKQMNMMEQEAVKRFSRQHGALSKAFSKHYTEHKLDKTLHERRRRIATQNAGLQAVQRHLENRQQSKPMMSWTSINSLPFQQLTDINQTSHYKPAEIQPIRGRLTGDRSAKHNGHKTRFLKLVETKVDLGMTKQV
ncbi:leucine-rich repeat and IQ domain-containing protein 3 isoform X4 [Tachysurus fulvidraco]|uniref:leucine-rich repeat and IQ domain-containing protein 3 isoform X4 n=1 Tax=Tachysurus fulvidraco TaxID=1234273 RepID=UPI000F51686E|nr:leucine-rich repeat and IQ domain-containing protein 3 isoform X4 [Tachysurus fulvidraco]